MKKSASPQKNLDRFANVIFMMGSRLLLDEGAKFWPSSGVWQYLTKPPRGVKHYFLY
jgi:hypothetical protein